MASEERRYVPKDAVARTVKATMVTTVAGALVSGVQNTLTKQNVGAMGIFTRTGGTIAVFGAMGGVYEFARTASANLRQKDDSWNVAIGGFLAGSVVGMSRRSLPAFLGYGALFGVTLCTFDYTGGLLSRGSDSDEFDKVGMKEYLRKNRRRPIEETIAELGEGRGIYGPGYEERRRERIKEKYGIDVPSVSSAQ